MAAVLVGAVAAAAWAALDGGAAVPFFAAATACGVSAAAYHFDTDGARARFVAAAVGAVAFVTTLGLQHMAPGGTSPDGLLAMLLWFPHAAELGVWAYALFACCMVIACALAVEVSSIAGVVGGQCCLGVELAAVVAFAAAELVLVRAAAESRARSERARADAAERRDKNMRLLTRVIPPVFIPQLARGQRVMSSRDDVCGACDAGVAAGTPWRGGVTRVCAVPPLLRARACSPVL